MDKPLFQGMGIQSTVLPYDQETMRLGTWHLSVTLLDVSPDLIDQVSALWFNGTRTPVGFLHDGKWRTGEAFLTEVTPSGRAYRNEIDCYIELTGTGELK